MISPGVFFIFSKFWFTESIEGKMAKTTIQNDKKFCLLHSISQEPCIVWLSFMVLMFKMTISPDVFSVLHNFDLFGLSGGWNGQKSPEMKKKMTYIISSLMVHMYVWKDHISRHFFHFFKILIFRIIRGVKGQKNAQNDKKFCLYHSISLEPYIIWIWFLVHV